MVFTKTIEADKVVFGNPYGVKNIELTHRNSNQKLKFTSEVEFKDNAAFETIQVGNWTINATAQSLEILEAGNTLFKVSKST